MRLALLLTLLVAAGAAAGQPPPLTPPAAPTVGETPKAEPVKPVEVRGRPGRVVRLTAGDKARAVRWELGCDADADLVPDGTSCGFVAAKAGKYVVLCYAAAGDVPGPPARIVVTIAGDDVDPKPVPVPPAPVPPTPVPPVPVPPADPLLESFQKAFADDPAPAAEKADARKDLAELYKQAAKLAEAAELKTAGELIDRVRAAGDALAADALQAVRKLAAVQLLAVLPDNRDAVLSKNDRAAAAAAFTRLAAILAAVK